MRFIVFCIFLQLSCAFAAEDPAVAREQALQWLKEGKTSPFGVVAGIGKLGGEQVDQALPTLIAYFQEHPEETLAIFRLMDVVDTKDTPTTDEQIEQLHTLVKDESGDAYDRWLIIVSRRDARKTEEREQAKGKEATPADR